MAFGWTGQNVANHPRQGFNPGAMLGGFNLGDGIRSVLGSFLNKEFKYSEVYNFLVSGAQKLANFDWNATDEEIRAKYKNLDQQLASAWGGVFGRGIGSATAIALGGGVGLVVPKISGARLSRQLMKAGTKDAKEEIIDEAIGAIQFTKNLATDVLVLEGYIKYRNFLRKMDHTALTLAFGKDTADFIKYQWGTENGADFRIAEKIEEFVEGINNEIIQAFVEEATEEFFEAFIETGYIIAYELDEALAQYQLAQSRLADPEVIEVFPNADNENESFIIEGDTQVEIEQETQQVLNNWRVLNNRDIGEIVTQDIEILEQHPQLRRLEITFKSVPTPPYINPDGTRARNSTITIPNVKASLTWRDIKRTLKYNKTTPSYTWGDSVAVLKFVDKRKIRIQFDRNSMTNEEVETYLKELAELSDGVIKTITINEYVEQPRQLRDRATGMYPLEARVVNRNLTDINRSNANSLPVAAYRFPIWVENEPEDFITQFGLTPPNPTP